MSTRVSVPLLALALLLMAPSPLWAEEQTPEDSAAARLFRDAWWKETGARDLVGAEKGYREATAAEGSEGVRARALYRLGVVQQRQGRTAEAKATLAQLPSRFPGEAEWLDKARKLTATWSAESVETSFSEWYQKHRYGPEFQKKILDLVLELAGTGAPAAAARDQLLIIGDAALPALQEHARNRNTRLATSCVDLIIQMGAFPSAEALVWRSWPLGSALNAMLRSKGAVRARLQAEFQTLADDEQQPDHVRSRAQDVLDMLSGPGVVLRKVVARTSEDDGPGSQVMSWAASEATDDPALRQWMVEVVEDTALDPGVREWLLSYVDEEWKEVGLPRIRRWLESIKDGLLEGFARNVLSRGHYGGAQAWTLRIPAVRKAAEDEDGGQYAVWQLVESLMTCPAEQDLSVAIEVLAAHPTRQDVHAAFRQWRGTLPEDSAGRQVLEAVIRKASGAEGPLLQEIWEAAHKKVAPTARMRAVWGDWAANAANEEVRLAATRGLARASGLSAEEIVQYLPGPDSPAPLRDAFFGALAGNQELGELEWNREGLRALLASLDQAGPSTSTREVWAGWPNSGAAGRQYSGRWGLSPQPAGAVFATLVREPSILRMLQAEALEYPTNVPVTFFRVVHPRLLADASVSEAALATAVARWPEHDKVGRIALLEHLRGGIVPKSQEKLVLRVVRNALPRLRGAPISPEFRYRLLKFLEPSLELSDAKALFDLSDPKQALLIVDHAEQFGATPAVFEACSSLLSKEAPEGSLQAFYRAFHSALWPGGPLSPFAPTFINAALAHGGDTEGEKGVEVLGMRLTTEDEALWLRALSHEHAAVRKQAASWLGRVYNRKLIGALVERMDDANPDVRDAVMSSLAAIEKVEERKARWRERAKDWVKEPATDK